MQHSHQPEQKISPSITTLDSDSRSDKLIDEELTYIAKQIKSNHIAAVKKSLASLHRRGFEDKLKENMLAYVFSATSNASIEMLVVLSDYIKKHIKDAFSKTMAVIANDIFPTSRPLDDLMINTNFPDNAREKLDILFQLGFFINNEIVECVCLGNINKLQKYSQKDLQKSSIDLGQLFYLAVTFKCISIIKFLLAKDKKDACLKEKSFYGKNPIACAIHKGSLDIVMLFTEHLLKKRPTDPFLLKKRFCADNLPHPSMVRPVSNPLEDPEPEIVEAVISGKMAIFEYLLAITQKSPRFAYCAQRAFFRAAFDGRLAMLKRLNAFSCVKLSSNKSHKPHQFKRKRKATKYLYGITSGDTGLILGVYGKHLHVIKWFLEQGVDTYEQGFDGMTALSVAINARERWQKDISVQYTYAPGDNFELAKFLVNHERINVNSQALHDAASCGTVELFNLILKKLETTTENKSYLSRTSPACLRMKILDYGHISSFRAACHNSDPAIAKSIISNNSLDVLKYILNPLHPACESQYPPGIDYSVLHVAVVMAIKSTNEKFFKDWLVIIDQIIQIKPQLLTCENLHNQLTPLDKIKDIGPEYRAKRDKVFKYLLEKGAIVTKNLFSSTVQADPHLREIFRLHIEQTIVKIIWKHMETFVLIWLRGTKTIVELIFPVELMKLVLENLQNIEVSAFLNLSFAALQELKSTNIQLPKAILALHIQHQEYLVKQETLAVPPKKNKQPDNMQQEQESPKTLQKTSQQKSQKLETEKTVKKKKSLISGRRIAKIVPKHTFFGLKNSKKTLTQLQPQPVTEVEQQEKKHQLEEQSSSTTLSQTEPLDENTKSKRKDKGKQVDIDYRVDSDDEYGSDSLSDKSIGSKF